MNKKFTAILTAMLCLTAPISAVAADITADDEVQYVYEASNFTYKTNNTLHDRTGFYLESELADPDLMVVGYFYSPLETERYEQGEFVGYIVTPINERSYLLAGAGTVKVKTVNEYLGGMELQVGDFLTLEGDCVVGEWYIPINQPEADQYGEIKYAGNGIEIFGEEFERVVRMQMQIDQTVFEKRWQEKLENLERYGISLVKGDVTVDDSVNILDSIQINKSLLAGAPLCDYAKLAGDVNENGALDADDSLMILKETIGLTENFE